MYFACVPNNNLLRLPRGERANCHACLEKMVGEGDDAPFYFECGQIECAMLSPYSNLLENAILIWMRTVEKKSLYH
jgi:hypothetical protein